MIFTHLFSFFTPKYILYSIFGNLRLAITHPKIFSSLFLRAIRSRHGFVQLLRLSVDLDTIRSSSLFDRKWLLEQHPEWQNSGLPVELHYLLYDVPDGRFSSVDFSADEYCELNPEVKDSGINPLVHYEQYGQFIGCPASKRDLIVEIKFPDDAVEEEWFFENKPLVHGRTCVFASFYPNGIISETDLIYLEGLNKVADNIVLVANSPILPTEKEKLKGRVSAAIFHYHEGYDFGSYRIGRMFADEKGWLSTDVCTELIFANSSCYGPVHPFNIMFSKMKNKECDFWGMTENTQISGSTHLQSYFLVFRSAILKTNALQDFFGERPLKASRQEAIRLYEVQLTGFLRDQGFKSLAYVPIRRYLRHEFNPTTRPIDLMRRFKVSLVKVKALRGESSQPPKQILDYVRKINPSLGRLLSVGAPSRPKPLTKD